MVHKVFHNPASVFAHFTVQHSYSLPCARNAELLPIPQTSEEQRHQSNSSEEQNPVNNHKSDLETDLSPTVEMTGP